MENRNTRGSEWRKWDLHIHTPSSYDYKDSSISNESLIESFSQKDIAGVAITDHHVIDISRIRELQQLGKSKSITVFPGIEFLSEARGKNPVHFIGIFSDRSDIDYIWKQIESKTNICKIQGEQKQINEVYCDLLDTTRLIHELGGIVTIHAGSKSNSLDNITNALPHCDAQKNDIAECIDVFELGKEGDVAEYKQFVMPSLLKNIGKEIPMILCSDNHDIKNYTVKQNCWIKADPTFEGLKQIIYEPEERVRIQSEKPEEKNNYQIIDFISFNNREMGTQKIEFNQNLNTIIGGRSSGKSILLGCLASLIDENCKPKEKNEDYNSNIRKLIDNATAVWKDSTSETRKIIYYSQSQISEIVRPDKYGISGINGLVEDIVKKDSKKSELIQQYEKSLIANRTEINTKINDFCDLKKQIKEKNQSISDIGNKKGIIGGIENLQNEINTIKKSISDYLSEAEDKEFNEQKDNLEKLNLCKKYLHADEAQFSIAKDSELFVSLDSLISSFSNYSHDKVVEFYNKLKIDTKKIWTEFIDKQIKEIDTNETEANNKIKEIQDSELYKKGISFQTNNELLQKKEGDLSIQIQKKYNIEKIEKELKQLKVSLKILKNDIWKNYFKYKILTQELSKELETKRDEVEINANIKLLAKDFFETTFEVVNRRTKEVQKY